MGDAQEIKRGVLLRRTVSHDEIETFSPGPHTDLRTRTSHESQLITPVPVKQLIIKMKQ